MAAAAAAADFDLDGLIGRLMTQFTQAPPQVDHQGVKDKRVAPPIRVALSVPELTQLCQLARDALLSEPVLLRIRAPLVVCGDIHGQYYDLMRIFQCTGHPDDTNYLFLGDYVDRGYWSIETIALLLCYRLKYPRRFFILRGNHESASISRMYGFYDECKRRFVRNGIKLWKTFVDVFNCLPVAAVIDDRIFCCHGGLSPELKDLEQINAIARPTDVPDVGLMCDLLWSDPKDGVEEWGRNNPRGVSYTFGRKALEKFLRKFDLDLVCRAHEVVEDGYEFFANRQLVTVFSAPNYCLADDMQLLTSGGWMFMDEYRRAHGTVDVAGYDPATRTLVYERPRAFIQNKARPDGTLVDFSPRDDRGVSWWDGGAAPAAAAGLLSVRVTPEHTMLARTGRRDGAVDRFPAATPRRILARDLVSTDGRDVLAVPCATEGGAVVEEVMRRTDAVEVPYAGRTWCVAMPSGYLVARRAAVNAAGTVTKASRPTVLGNCNDFDNAAGIMVVQKDLTCSFRILKPTNRPPLMPDD